MQLTLSHSHLQRLTRAMAKIIPGRGSVMPALDQVRFRRLGQNDAEVTATNLDETLTLVLPGTAAADTGPDVFLCPFAELRSLAKDMGRGDAALLAALPGETPSLDIAMQVSGRDIRNRIDLMPVTEFPETQVAVATVPADVGAFLQAFRTALPFTSDDPTRAVLNGVFWHDEAHAVVATDGTRLTLLRLEALSLGQDIIVPKSKLLANGVLDGTAGTLGVATVGERTHLDITCGSWHYQGRGVEGQYPNYTIVIPQDFGQFVATVEIAPADVALVRSAIPRLTTGHDCVVHICAVPGAAPLLVSNAVAAGGGRAQVELANSRCSAEALRVQAINGHYLLECLEAGFLTLRLPPDCSPWLCTGERPGLHCVMPMREENNDIVAFVAGRLNPGGMPMPPVGENAPTVAGAPESGAPAETAGTATTETAGGSAESTAPGTPAAASGTAGTAVPQLSLVESDPLQDLRDTVAEAETALRQAAAAVRSLREKARAVDRFIRDREKQYARNEKVIGQLKEVVGF